MTKLKQLKCMLCLVLALVCNVTWAQTYSPTVTKLTSTELNEKTAPTLVAIKNLSATNNAWFVGNTGAVPYSVTSFSETAVFVWQPVTEGQAGSYYLMKLDGTYMQTSSPKDFGTKANAAVFTTTNPTSQGSGSTNFNGDGDSQSYINGNDDANLVRFVTSSKWINVQNASSGTPTYNTGLGGWTIHYVYSVSETNVPETPEIPENNLPVAGKYYRIGYDFGGDVGVKYIQSTASGISGKDTSLLMNNNKDEESIFLLEQVDGNLRLKSVSTGKYLKEDNSSRGLYDTGGNVTFTEGADGKFKIQTTSYLHANSSGSTYFIDHCGSDGGHATHNFIVEEVISKYAFPENGKTYYIYSDTYHNNAFVNRFLYADGASLKMNTALSLNDNYKWICTVNNDGSMTFQNGAGKYLGYKTMADAPYNFTVANTSVHNKNAVTLYANEATRYIVVHNDGTQFNHARDTYNQETEDYCTDFVFIEADNVHLLSVNGDSKVKATATWNNETKVLPASWMVFKGDEINNPTLTVTPEAAYSLLGLYSDDVNKGTSIEITSLEDNLELTARYSPAFFSTTYGEKWVRLSNCSNNSYWATIETTGTEVKGKTATLDYADEKQLWCLVGTAESFVLYNKAAGNAKALKVTADTYGDGSLATIESDLTATWKLKSQDFGYALVPTQKDNNSEWGINMYGGANGDLKLYGTGAGNKGSYWVVELADVNNPLTLNVEVDQVWESSPRVAELTFTINGKASQTRILGSIEGQTLYLPAGATYEVSSMTYRGYTYNGCTDNDGVLTASYTANDERTLFYSPRDGHPYRIPAIATAPNGDIFAICDYRPCGNDIGYGEVDLVCRVSSDNGVTWTEERTIADGLGHINDGIWKMGFGDPAIVADRESNKVLVMSVCGNRTCWDGNYGEGGENENPNRVSRLYITYDEDKQEWVYGEPEEVTYDVYPKFVDKDGNVHAASLFIGAGKICQSRVVKKGEYYRLYCAVWNVTKTQRQHHNYVIYSDDFGKTWNVLGDLGYENSASKWGNEPKVEELPDGTVVLSSRKYNGRYFNLFTFADDTYTTGSWMGEVGSNEVQGGLSFGGNSTNGEIYKVKAIHKESGRICDLMFQSIPTGGGRDNVAIYYKEMEYNENGTNKYTSTTFAQGWTKGIHVSTKGSCYSTMISQADGRIAFFFEEEPSGYCMVYIPYTIEELTGDAYTLYTVNSTIGQYKIGTFYASEAVVIPEGVQAYVATKQPEMNGTDAEGNATGVITMTELEGIIPANTGAVLRGEAKTYEFIPSISYGKPVEGNMMVGYEGAAEYEEVSLPTDGSTNYVLAVEDGKAGFYRKKDVFNVYNNKAYLNVPGSAAGARAIYFNFGGETGILETENGNVKTENCYDLSGRRVQKAQKGIYIVNGKKVVY